MKSLPIPKYKIETLTGATTDYTITEDAVSIFYKSELTTGIGNFTIVLPTKTTSGYKYDDIALSDKVQIYLGYDTVPVTPTFVGRISKISGPLSTEQGYVRNISGLGLGEILLRRSKTNKYYNGVDADTIVADIVDDLSSDASYALGHDHTQCDSAGSADYHVTLEIRTQTYYDILRFISDYWASAGNEIKKDFYVDTSNRLVWKDRPIRTSGVETFTVGDNIISYNVARDWLAVKNQITVLGTAGKYNPIGKDEYTEEDAGTWHITDDTAGILDVHAPVQVGTHSIEAQILIANQTLGFHRHLTSPLNVRSIEFVQFWFYDPTIDVAGIDHRDLYIYAPNLANSFQLHGDMGPFAGWVQRRYNLGSSEEYDVDANPDGIWDKNGTPNWWDIEGIGWRIHWGAGLSAGTTCNVDGLYFYPERFSHTETDAPSIASYGRMDLEVTDDKLHSDVECEARAHALIPQLKDAPIEVSIVVPGNANILIGDQLHITIPAEGLSASHYDVTAVENLFSSARWTTAFTGLYASVNPSSIREVPPSDLGSIVSRMEKRLDKFARDEKQIR